MILLAPVSDPLTGLQWLCSIPFVSVIAVGSIAGWHKLIEKPSEPIREGDCLPLATDAQRASAQREYFETRNKAA